MVFIDNCQAPTIQNTLSLGDHDLEKIPPIPTATMSGLRTFRLNSNGSEVYTELIDYGLSKHIYGLMLLDQLAAYGEVLGRELLEFIKVGLIVELCSRNQLKMYSAKLLLFTCRGVVHQFQ